jgi:hypothetical protein
VANLKSGRMFSGLIIAMQSAVSNSTSTQDILNGIQNFNKGVENLGSNVPTVFETAGLALLGLLIPFAIVILQDVLGKRDEVKNPTSIWDKAVILDNVFKFKPLIVLSGLVFIPFVFWDLEVGIVRLIEIIIASVGILLLVRLLLRVYDWTEGNCAKYRKEYLEGKTIAEKSFKTTWKSIWGNKMTLEDEAFYFNLFREKIDQEIKKK